MTEQIFDYLPITRSAAFKKYLKINFFKIFFDHPAGLRLDQEIIILLPNNLHNIMQ